MPRRVDLARAKEGDKAVFRCGAQAVVKSAALARHDAAQGDIYKVTFQDGFASEFRAGGQSAGGPITHRRIGETHERLTDDFNIVSLGEAAAGKRKKPLSLSRAFNLKSRRIGDGSSRHPALEFQTKNKLRGIAGRYRIPGGVTASMYEDMMSDRLHERVRREAAIRGLAGADFWDVAEKTGLPDFLEKSWKKLVSLNPALKKVKLDMACVEDVYNAHLGVTSGFNVDDINFFLEQKHVGEGLPARQAHAMPVHGERLDRIEAVAASRMFWVVSPKTAEKIEERFKRRGLFKPKPGRPPAP